jgi:hypothetical protein
VECDSSRVIRKVGEHGEKPVLFLYKKSAVRITESLLNCVYATNIKEWINGFRVAFKRRFLKNALFRRIG